MPKLSICIATWNRAAYLGATLNSILGQVTDEVEVVVVDGASTDNTEAVMHAYEAKFPCVHYVRLDKKGGVDRDFDLCVQQAQGTYCWLLGDDDLLLDGAVHTVLATIDRGFPLVVVNSEIWNADYSFQYSKKFIPIESDRIYGAAENDRLLAEIGANLTFIGCVVIRRDLWLQRERTRYYGTEFIHVGVIFQAPIPGLVCVVEKPLIMIRYGVGSWTGRAFQIWMFKWPDLVWSFDHYSAAVRAIAAEREPWRHGRLLLSYRALGAYSRQEYRLLVKERRLSTRSRLQALAVTFVPGVLANFIYVIYLKLRRPDEHMALSKMTSSPYYYKRFFHRS